MSATRLSAALARRSDDRDHQDVDATALRLFARLPPRSHATGSDIASAAAATTDADLGDCAKVLSTERPVVKLPTVLRLEAALSATLKKASLPLVLVFVLFCGRVVTTTLVRVRSFLFESRLVFRRPPAAVVFFFV